MPETVSLNEDLEIIEVRSFDDVSLSDVDNSLLAVEALHEKNGVAKVLVDVREHTSMPKMSGAFQIASSIPRFIKLALLFSEGQPTEEDIHFVETMANSGGATVQSFTSKEEALAWLNE